MQKILVLFFMLLSASYVYSICPCPGYAGHDYFRMTEVSVNPEEGIIYFDAKMFSTCADGIHDHGNPKFYITDECNESMRIGVPLSSKYMCGWICPICGCAEPCPVAPHFYNEYSFRVVHGGEFNLSAYFKGVKIFSKDYSFKEVLEEQAPIFYETDIMSRSGEYVSDIAYFDIDEGIIIEAIVDWDVDPYKPERYIEAVLKTDNGDDSMIVSMSIVSSNRPSRYRTSLSDGFARNLYTNADFYFITHTRDILRVYAKRAGCFPEEYNGPADRIYLTKFRFELDTLSFINGLAMCKENTRSGTPPTLPIDSVFQWTRFGKNEPACYVRNNPIAMEVRIKANHPPRHTLPFSIYAINDGDEYRYNVVNADAELDWDSLTIDTVFSYGTIPDSIGCDTLSYNWKFDVSSYRVSEFDTTSGPHIIYRTYATPIISNSEVYPINLDACLNKVCVLYAPDKDTADTILRLVSDSISNAYNYDPGLPYPGNVMDLYRSTLHTGQCGSYAAYMTAICNSIGIPINCRLIFSGNAVDSIEILSLSWFNTYYSPQYWWHMLWTLPDRDGANPKLPDNAYNFIYHVVTHCVNDSGVSMIYDPVWSVNDKWQDWIGSEFRYYYNDLCVTNEPPSQEPAYYDWPLDNIQINTPFNGKWSVRRGYCIHP